MADKSTVTLHHKDTDTTIETAPGNMDNMALMGWLPEKQIKKRAITKSNQHLIAGENEDGKS